MKHFSNCCSTKIFLFFSNFQSGDISKNRLFIFALLPTPKFKEKATFKLFDYHFFLSWNYFETYLRVLFKFTILWKVIFVRNETQDIMCVLANSWIFCKQPFRKQPLWNVLLLLWYENSVSILQRSGCRIDPFPKLQI